MSATVTKPVTVTDGSFSRASTGTFIGSNGLIQTAAIDVPRFQYDALDLTAPSIFLAEATATNLLAYSEQFDNAVWLKSAATVTANATIAPDGTTTADKLVETAATLDHSITQAVAVANATAHTVSAYLKAGERTQCALLIFTGASIYKAIFSLSDGTFVSSAGTGSYTIDQTGNGWYRIAITATSTSTTLNAFIFPASGGVTSYTGDGTSGLFVWRAQLEVGAFATSPIPTLASQVTRAADIVSSTGLIYSSVPETDYTEWNAATSYTVSTRVMRSVAGVHKNFENLIAGINATLPENATTGTTPRWLDLGATNRWAQFDNKVGTVTTNPLTLTQIIKPGNIGSIYLGNLTGKTAVVTAKNVSGGTLVYSKTINLDGRIIGSFYDWFFTDYVQKTDVLLNDLPNQYYGLEVTVTITTDSGNVGIGACQLGKVTELGETKYGAGVGIISFAKKVPDIFGNITVFRPTNPNSNRMSLQLMLPKENFTNVFNTLKSLDAILCVYSAVELDGFEPFIVLGFYKDFFITVEYFNHYLCSLEIEGVN